MPPAQEDRKDLWRMVITVRADTQADALRQIAQGKMVGLLAHNLSEIHRRLRTEDKQAKLELVE